MNTEAGSVSVIEMIAGASPVVQGVLYLLILVSIASWAVIIYKARYIYSARTASERFIEMFWETPNLSEVSRAAAELPASPVADVFDAGYQELLRLRSSKRSGEGGLSTELGGIENVERAMRRAARLQRTHLEKLLTFLATTASTTPFVGLFGTVWGIMNSFRGLTRSGSSSIQAVAPGISEALVATALGLAAAIPALVAYNHFARRTRVIADDMENFSSEFLNIAERHFLG